MKTNENIKTLKQKENEMKTYEKATTKQYRDPVTLKMRRGNANSALGFNFNYTLYCSLKDDWYEYSTKNYYDKTYVCDVSKIEASSLKELKIIMDQI